MEEGSKSRSLQSLREENLFCFERIRAGERDVPDLLEQAEASGEVIAVIECLITRVAKQEMDNEIRERTISLTRIHQLLDSGGELLLLPRMRWALELNEALAAFVGGDFVEALRFARLAEQLVPDADYDDALPSTLNLLGLLAYRVEAFDQAVELFTRSIAEGGSTRTTAISHSHLGTVLESQGELELVLTHRQIVDALVHGPEATFSISDGFRFDCDHCRTLILLGQFGEVRNRLAAMDRSRPDAHAFATGIEARRALAEQDYDEAYEFAIESARAFDEMGMVNYRRRIVDVQVDVLLHRGRHQEAIDLLTKDLAPPDTIDHLKACSQLIEANKYLGAWEEVCHYQELQRDHLEQSQIDLHSFHQVQEQSFRFEDLQAKNMALDERNQEFEMLRSDRENLLNIVAHELRSPLTALGLVLHSIDEGSGNGVRLDDRIRTGSRLVRRLQGLADQVAMVGELASGTFELELSVVELDAVVENVLDELMLTARRKEIQISFSPCGLAVLGHRGRLEQVLTNLISNSIKFSCHGTAIMIRTASSGGSVELSVIDQGLGLTEADLARVFRRHARLSARPTGGEASSGMGLYIAKQLALAMGGNLSARSAGRGHGATFTLNLSEASDSAGIQRPVREGEA